jgi:hypothetical protein
VIALAAFAVFVGAVLQSATGFGFALVAAPILFAALGPQEAVTAGVLLGVQLSALTLATERRRPQVLRREALALLAWSLPGLVVGAIALRELDDRVLSVLVALGVLAALGLRLGARWAATAPATATATAPAAGRARSWRPAVAGASSGALSTSTSLSGPPLVFYLLTRAISPVQMRDTLAAIFVVQSVLGVPALVATGTLELPHALWTLLAGGLAGQLLGRRAFAWLRAERYERAVLVVLALTALVALAASAA